MRKGGSGDQRELTLSTSARIDVKLETTINSAKTLLGSELRMRDAQGRAR
jgi:hypothetical protein